MSYLEGDSLLKDIAKSFVKNDEFYEEDDDAID